MEGAHRMLRDGDSKVKHINISIGYAISVLEEIKVDMIDEFYPEHNNMQAGTGLPLYTLEQMEFFSRKRMQLVRPIENKIQELRKLIEL